MRRMNKEKVRKGERMKEINKERKKTNQTRENS
jgi:hypothetical protein